MDANKETGYKSLGTYTSLAELNEEWEDAPEEKKYGGRVPKKGDTFWFVSSDGHISEVIWEGTKWDIDRFEAGSAFWPREEAEKECKRRKAYYVLKEDTKGFEPDWENYRHKYTIYYNHNDKSLYIDDYAIFQLLPNDLIFANRADAKASIKVHEKEWKTWLGVEE